MRFKDKVILLTGASGGIGKATAKCMAQEGGLLALVGRDPHRTREVAGQTGAFYHSTADITRSETCGQIIQEIVAARGRLDVLINNAGAIVRADICDTTDEQWRSIMAINVDAPFFLARQAVQVMRNCGKGGAIVNVSSINGFVGRETLVAYSTSKGAVIQMTQSMALDCAKDNIRVNAVCPGATDTPMPFSQHENPVTREQMAQVWKEKIPLQRMGTPEEIARSIAFLASSDAGYLTGTSLMVDGGFTCQ
ncbi:MAG: SDR family oxidoreductase [Desulfotignum sp.]|nr:SDR family oxidoreductase [Desulfotignum sp.]MCF8088209.1 SDR family oxidoreductase [Desulfotignum sp.]MCF8136008.1 SDR family oxidoreductase [Desulfotignum sp.]